MYAGNMVETAATGFSRRPLHPYTQGLDQHGPAFDGRRYGRRIPVTNL